MTRHEMHGLLLVWTNGQTHAKIFWTHPTITVFNPATHAKKNESKMMGTKQYTYNVSM